MKSHSKPRSLKTLLASAAQCHAVPDGDLPRAAVPLRSRHHAHAQAAPFVIRPARPGDAPARERLLDVCFGANRRQRTCERLREGRLPAQGLAFTALHKGRVAGTVRLWHVTAGFAPALVLGPLGVDPASRGLGIGAALMNHAIFEARRLGHGAIILLGDAPYYARFGFAADKAASLALPGPFARERLLALELKRGALSGASGVIRPNGAFAHSAWEQQRVHARAAKAA